jgi:lamin tail-like protein
VWSPLTEASFEIDTVPLRVTELMYHPAPPAPGGPFNADDFEFIELQNVGDQPLDLSGVNFDKGITFTFPDGYTLDAGAYAVVVRNAAAFAERYGDGVVPAGVFTGGLNDAGERVRLLDAPWVSGRTIIDFTYSDAWQPRTDGGGYSLVPRDASAPPEAWEDPSRWRYSRATGGNPSAADPGPAAGVAGRWLFYSRSAFDGTTVNVADSSDDNALARGKVALLPGQRSSAANYSTNSRGINGLFVDLANLAYGAALTAADFVFRVGTTADPSTWAPAPAPNLVAIRPGAGVDGSDRVTIGWADANAIRNAWLQVTVVANARTGLSSPDVFYFGHLQGDASDTATGAAAATVDARDEAVMRRRASRTLVNGANVYDFNKDGIVNAQDLLVTRRAARTSLVMFTAPAAGAAGAAFSQTPVGMPPSPTRTAPARRNSLLAPDPDLLA